MDPLAKPHGLRTVLDSLRAVKDLLCVRLTDAQGTDSLLFGHELEQYHAIFSNGKTFCVLIAATRNGAEFGWVDRSLAVLS